MSGAVMESGDAVNVIGMKYYMFVVMLNVYPSEQSQDKDKVIFTIQMMLFLLTLKLYLCSYVRQSSVVDETFPPIENRKMHHDMMRFVYSDSDDLEDGSNCADNCTDNEESDWECYPSGLESDSFYSEY